MTRGIDRAQAGVTEQVVSPCHRRNRLEPYLRRLLVIGMTSQLQSARRKPEAHPWITNLLVSKPNKLVAVAMANKAARIAWVMTRGEVYRARRPATEGTV